MTSSSPTLHRDLPGRDLSGVLAIAATYIYFLLYAQFGFLDLLREHLGASPELQAAMASMGLAGFLASLATGSTLRTLGPRDGLRLGFAGCALTAILSLACDDVASFLLVAALIGIFTAVLTVTLATHLRVWIRGRRFGLTVGLGTGLAYFVCNLPPLFEGSPAVRAVASAAACLLGAAAAWRRDEPRPSRPARPALVARDFRGLGFAALLLSFLALIWLDSAAFAVIQENLALKGLTWGGGAQLFVLGATHFLAAVASGWLIDRGFFRSLLLGTFVLFTVAFTALEHLPGALWLAGPIYAVGISLYSVALVAYPAYRHDEDGLVPRRWRSAAVFGVAGWIGSALGVGMAQDLHRIPGLFLIITGSLLFAAWFLARARPGRLVRLARIHALTLIIGAAGVLFFSFAETRPAVAGAIERGREVYVSEGCIGCHSQYIRPRGRDVELFGPHREIDRHETPPLVGNRRQGPDLANVGTRRSAAWHKLHLVDPRALMPASRMPSYAHLFRENDSRGDDLVAYLTSLGEDAVGEWYEITRAYPMDESVEEGSTGRGQEIFGDYCAACHGPGGRGDGQLSPAVYRPAMNLRKESFWLITWGPGAESEAAALARLVKFGMPGTSMPGHEYLTDAQVADVVAFVRTLRGRDAPRVAAAGDEVSSFGWAVERQREGPEVRGDPAGTTVLPRLDRNDGKIYWRRGTMPDAGESTAALYSVR